MSLDEFNQLYQESLRTHESWQLWYCIRFYPLLLLWAYRGVKPFHRPKPTCFMLPHVSSAYLSDHQLGPKFEELAPTNTRTERRLERVKRPE